MSALLEADKICWERDGRAILKCVSLSVEPGESVALIGPNGSGKTTLLRILAALHRDYSGRVQLDGVDVRTFTRDELKRRVSLVPQRVEFLPPFTVSDFIELSGTDAAEERALLLEGLADKRLPELSGGELQKVVIAGALAQGATLVLLDEPTANLDPSGRRIVESTLRRCRSQRRVATVVVTHDLDLMGLIADRVIILTDGRITWEGTPSDPAIVTALEDAYRSPFIMIPHPTRGGSVLLPR